MPLRNISSNSVEAARFRVKFKDIWNVKQFYEDLHFWLLEYGWSSVAADGNSIEDGEQWETLYLEKEGVVGDKEMWWWWRLQKKATDNSYYKYHLDLDSHLLYILPAEVMRDGKKFKAQKGEIEITVTALLEFDIKGAWSKHPILRFFSKVFPKRIFKEEMYESHKMELYREAYICQAFIKKWFKLYSFLPFEEVPGFFPSKAYPEWKKE